MNIIFGLESVSALDQRYTLLELDTFVLRPTNEVITAYCLVEKIPVHEMPAVAGQKQQQSALMAEYRKRNWEFCENTIQQLTGKWGGEVDSFYEELYQRIQTLKCKDLPTDWNGQIEKTVEVVTGSQQI